MDSEYIYQQLLTERTQDNPRRVVSQMEKTMLHTAVDLVVRGTAWMSVPDWLKEYQKLSGDTDAQARIQQWIDEKHVVTLQSGHLQYVPVYMLDKTCTPIPGVKTILHMMDNRSAFQLLAWFESTSSTLNGQRPREIIANDYDRVEHAAHRHMEGPVHG